MDRAQFFQLVTENLAESGQSIDIDEIHLLEAAWDLAQNAHTGQLRASGEDYFLGHCVPVAIKLSTLRVSADVIAAGLLHDSIEDTSLTRADIAHALNEEIASLVDGVSKIGQVKYRGNDRYTESLRKFFIALAKDVRVVIIKFADRWHNLETLQFLPPEKQKRIAKETLQIYGPIALRLNFGKMAGILNDLAFPYADPDAYKAANNERNRLLKQGEKTITKLYRDVHTLLHQSLGYTPHIDRRIKGMYSFYKKLHRKDGNAHDIHDVMALRVIVRDVADCYKALGVIHRNWRPVPGSFDDYIATPKPNGYRSLHTSILTGQGPIVEVQIKTEEMHQHNEFGSAAHGAYKEKSFYGSSGNLSWLGEISSLSQHAPDKEYLHELKMDLFQDRIFALTPKGDVIDLPQGATALDFAFAVHGDIGCHAIGAHINGKWSALKTVLQSEDIVNIETDPKVRPSHKWTEWVTTARARDRIRKSIGNHPPTHS